jgi:hypothetical protein
MMIPCLDISREDYDFALMRKMLGIWRRVAELMLGVLLWQLAERARQHAPATNLRPDASVAQVTPETLA